LALIHVFLNNARYHHAKLVRNGLPGQIGGSSCISFRPIARISIQSCGCMHRNATHNKAYATCAQFADAALDFLRNKVPHNSNSAIPSSTISVSSNRRIFEL
jgi:hypothetical protein